MGRLDYVDYDVDWDDGYDAKLFDGRLGDLEESNTTFDDRDDFNAKLGGSGDGSDWCRDAGHNRIPSFYVNLGSIDPAFRRGGDNTKALLVNWCKVNGLSRSYYWWGNTSVFTKRWVSDQARYLRKERANIERAFPQYLNPERIFLEGFFQAMAFAVEQPDVFFFTPARKDWKEKSIWQTAEYPALTRNPYVQRIWRIDPSYTGNYTELLWDRARDDPLPPIGYYPA
ncbi:uncharacterized protein AB675_8770 [Cyphellophora attinorum]|uniref:Uncharacterized protein n=1 Tax=Cyphellophora attinorum TaxID=1664694 RepID=A0A0N0NQZ4_9EURO|nr:uncharacterized protein AB675_8770 [Phialophora attinorum]KPI44488.1 hypothetical protein AB675_8770 [Phialophora attinorum]